MTEKDDRIARMSALKAAIDFAINLDYGEDITMESVVVLADGFYEWIVTGKL